MPHNLERLSNVESFCFKYETFIKSQLALSNQLEGLAWCKSVHVETAGSRPRTPPSEMAAVPVHIRSASNSDRGTLNPLEADQSLYFKLPFSTGEEFMAGIPAAFQ